MVLILPLQLFDVLSGQLVNLSFLVRKQLDCGQARGGRD